MNETTLNNIESYLYLHPSENPSIALVSPVLDSTNYHSWIRSMITALSAKNKLEFVDGSAPEPLKTDRTYGAWRWCNNMVLSWIVHSVAASIRQSILWMDKAEDIWRDLKTRYSQGDLLRISDLQQEASTLRQGTLSVTEYFTRLRVIWDEIENFRPDPACTCNVRCSCSAFAIIAQRKLEDRAMQFLRGLNDQYTNIRSHVLLMDPIPAITKIFSYVAQQERQLLGNSSPNLNFEPKDVSINAAKTICDYCGRIGHTENICYKKHGMPLNHETRNKGTSGRKSCTHCGRMGHTVDVCYRKHGYPPGYKPYNGRSTVNNVVTMDSQPMEDQNQHRESQDVVRFSPEQYKALLALIKQSSTGSTTLEQTKQVASISSCAIDKPSSPGCKHSYEDWYS
ncbi:uncharacterized protein [Glycine max]|uniref:uncharacterized protein n=1 Tax=Glycine max TaxID=3847 RepID=UPI0003DE9C18|nr:uncharacterized protein LOC102664271 [Glycine max]|eukprot:XP_025982783.1 uncharacterized protein LOC102664271 [Glycine max]